MALSVDQLVFNTAATSDSSNVGAYIRASDGTLIDYQTIATKKWLDVASALFDGSGNAISSTAGALNVNVSSGSIDVGVADGSTFTAGTSIEQPAGGLYATSYTALATGKTGAFAMTAYRALSVNLNDAAGNVLIGQKASAGSVPVVIASDQSAFPVKLEDGSGNSLSSTSGALNSFITNTSLAVTQSGTWTQRLQDGSGNAITSTSSALDVNIKSQTGTVTVSDAALANTGFLVTQVTTTGTAAVLLATQLTNRKYMFIQNAGIVSTYIGASGVTTATGFRIPAGATFDARCGAAINFYAIGASDVRVLELN